MTKSKAEERSTPLGIDREGVRPTAASLVNDKHHRRASKPIAPAKTFFPVRIRFDLSVVSMGDKELDGLFELGMFSSMLSDWAERNNVHWELESFGTSGERE